MVHFSFITGFTQCTTASQVRSTNAIFSCLAGALVVDCITCFTTQRIMFWCEHTIMFSHIWVFICLNMFHSYVPFICYPSIPVCSCRLSRVIHQHTFSHLAGTQQTDCITCLTLQTFLFWFPHTIAFSPVFQCLSLHMFELVYVFTCLFLFSFIYNLSIPVCPHMA